MSKILIIDDVFLYQLSLGEIIRELDGKSEITHVSSLHDGEAALKAVNFDLVIVDIQIHGYTVIDMIDFIGRFSNSSRMMIFSLANENVYADRCLIAGAKGFILKSSQRQQIETAIFTVLNGKRYVSENVHRMLLAAIPVTLPYEPKLVPREKEVMHLVLQGLNTREISQVMNIMESTVCTYRANIFRKLKVKNVKDLAAKVRV